MKKIIVTIISCILGFALIIGCGSNINGISKMKVKDQINGTGDTKIGEYGISYFSEDMTDEKLVEFYNKNIKDSKLNYSTLINKDDDTKGYVFNGTSGTFSYGSIDKDGMLDKAISNGYIDNGKVKIENK